MKKEEYIRKYGPAAWEAKLSKARRTRITNKVDKGLKDKKESKTENYIEQQELMRVQWKKDKGTKRRSRLSEDVLMERQKIRHAHYIKWGGGIDLDIHHGWIGDTADYQGVALVERDAHRRGIINIVIPIEGGITEFERK